MKKKLILSALMLSLSLNYTTFAAEKHQKQNNLSAKKPLVKGIENPLFKIAKKEGFECFNKDVQNNLKKALNESQKNQKDLNILSCAFTLGGLSAIAASTYFTCSQGHSNIPLRKATLTIFTLGLSYCSKRIIASSAKKFFDTTNKYQENKNATQEKIAQEIKCRLEKYDINAYMHSIYINMNIKDYFFNLPEVKKIIEDNTKNRDQRQEELDKKERELFTQMRENLKKQAQKLTDQEKTDLIEKLKIQKKNPSMYRDTSAGTLLFLKIIKYETAYKWYQENKNLGSKNFPVNKSTIAPSLFNIAGCIAWTPDILPYVSPLCAYFKNLSFFTKS